MKKSVVIHPILLAIFPVVFLFAHNITQLLLNNREVYIILGLLVTFASLMWVLLTKLLKDKQKAGLALSLFLFMLFSYGHFSVLVGEVDLHIGKIIIGKQKLLFPSWCILLLAGSYFTIRTRKNLNNLTRVINIIAIILICIPLIKIAVYQIDVFRVALQKKKNTTVKDCLNWPSQVKSLPDIYYLVPDSYANEETLRKFYDFDNSDFIAYLRKKGFYVVPGGMANYPKSAYSLASSLNMEHITYLAEQMGENCQDWSPFYEKLSDYKIWRFLKLGGYKFIHMGLWWEFNRVNKYADMNFTLLDLPEFTLMLYQTTPLYPVGVRLELLSEIANPFKIKWKKINAKFDRLAEVPDIKGPKFVFAHFSLPHVPHVFDENGGFLSKRKTGKNSVIPGEFETYTTQIIFANKKFKELIEILLSKSRIQPVIVLQSDEGPSPARWFEDQVNFNWGEATPWELRKKLGILNAYYVPGIDKKTFYPGITPVNSFRLIFNFLFGTRFELLPDENYVTQDLKHLYKFINVTEKIKQKENEKLRE